MKLCHDDNHNAKIIMQNDLKREKIHFRLCGVFLFSILLTPMIIIPGFMGVKLEDLVVFMIVFYFFAAQNITFKLPIRALLFLIFIPLLLISVAMGSFMLMPTTITDLTKYIWLLKGGVIYLVFYNYMYSNEEQEDERVKKILMLFISFSVLASFICFQQYFNLFGLNKFYLPFVAPTQMATLMEGYGSPRVVGMLGNPNAQGYAFAIALICCLYLYLMDSSKKVLVYSCFIFLGLIMTLSRGSLLCFVAGAVFLFLVYKKNWLFSVYKIIFLSIASVILTILFLWLKDNEVIYNMILFRFEALSNITEDRSFIARYHGWIINYEYFKLSPLFGVGPLPRSIDIFGMADNEWLFFLRAYGAIGTLWLLLFMVLPFFLKKHNNLKKTNRKKFAFSCVMVTGIYMIPAGVVTSSVLFPVFLVVLAMYDVDKKSITLSKRKS
jgi:hypothetical protein